MKYISTKGMSRAEWLEARKRGIGGSDAAKILLSPEAYRYADRGKLLEEKTGGGGEDAESLPCRIGNALEPLAAELYEEATGRRVHQWHRMIISEEHPFMIADIDRKLSGCDEGLECKTIGEMAARMRLIDPDTGEVSWTDRFIEGDMETSLSRKPEWYCQIQHYMAVTGWKMWHLSVIIGNRRHLWYDVPRDEEFIAELISQEGEFWNEVLEKRGEGV